MQPGYTINRMSVSDYESFDQEAKRDAYMEELRKRHRIDSDQINCITRAQVWDDEAEQFVVAKRCYYNQFGFFFLHEDNSMTATQVSKFTHWDARIEKQDSYTTLVISTIGALILYNKSEVQEYLEFCAEYNNYIDALIEDAISLSRKHYERLYSDKNIRIASLNLVNMLYDELFNLYNVHNLLIQLLSLNCHANEVFKTYYSLSSEMIKQSLDLVNQDESTVQIFQDAIDKISVYSNILHEKYEVPTFCNGLVACWLVQRVASAKYYDQWVQEYDRNANNVEAPEYVESCVRNGILTQDDSRGLMLLSWAIESKSLSSEPKITQTYTRVNKQVESVCASVKKESFERRLFSDHISRVASQKKPTIDDIDLMTGVEFEQFIADYFKKKGYQATITKGSGDQGIDVIIEKDTIRIGIQAKCYGSSVGNTAVQEAVAGKAFYNLDRIMVITNNFFSNSAIQLAQANNVVLWDRNILKEKISTMDD